MSYPCTRKTPIGGDEAARNTVQPSLHRSVSCCASPHWRDALAASTGANSDLRSPNEKRRSMTWAQRLKRVFNIDVSTCGHCGGTLRIVVSEQHGTNNMGHPLFGIFRRREARFSD